MNCNVLSTAQVSSQDERERERESTRLTKPFTFIRPLCDKPVSAHRRLIVSIVPFKLLSKCNLMWYSAGPLFNVIGCKDIDKQFYALWSALSKRYLHSWSTCARDDVAVHSYFKLALCLVFWLPRLFLHCEVRCCSPERRFFASSYIVKCVAVP